MRMTETNSVYLQHDLAVMHVRLSEPELQQLHVTDFPANTQQRTEPREEQQTGTLWTQPLSKQPVNVSLWSEFSRTWRCCS